ncbi:DUF5017 domain-containing protein [Niabella beijingensis]|uniref:DUF5017 domain-containing protein n=1 Tax=Niabella beijingensis TaxID=2872700 RepID=UPI001CBCA666|nr:DUF5017 domain-containing protein [Niabella beijingensis]MBZ4191414.1 DUF5017 domain-containing protein [Niabella beijingensis]
MKNRFCLPIALVCLLFLWACKKTLSSGDTDFTVTVENNVLSLNDTARFVFNKNPDVLVFYSGEIGHRYAFKGRTSAEGTPLLRFSTKRENGSQPQSLQLLISSDFRGVIKGDTAATTANLAAASWTDITSRATLSGGGSAPVASGDIDLSDYTAKPVFLAFKYRAAAGSVQNKWTISAFTVTNELEDNTSYIIANMNTATTAFTNYGVTTFSPGFAAYTPLNNYRWNISNTQLVITGANSAAFATDPAEAWVFIGPLNLTKVTPDVGVPLKNASENISGSVFGYQYQSTGQFDAVFEGGLADIKQIQLVTRPVRITVQ